ncbi:MAG: phosphoribosylamine--glycine ligase family protein, partial [Campylobacter lanienae]
MCRSGVTRLCLKPSRFRSCDLKRLPICKIGFILGPILLCTDHLGILNLNRKYMNILIIGSGGREYAIGLRLTQDSQKHNLFFAPGNGATSNLGQNVDIKDFNELAKFALNSK